MPTRAGPAHLAPHSANRLTKKASSKCPAHLGPGFKPSNRTAQITTRAPRGVPSHYIIPSRTLSPNPTRRRRLLLLQAAPPLTSPAPRLELPLSPSTMADVEVDTEVAAAGQPKKRTFRKYSYRGVDLDALLDMSTDDLVQLFPARARRRFQRGLKRKPMALIKKLRKAKKDAPAGEKPEPVRTHLRNMIIVPEMIGSIIGVYNGKTFNQVEIKPEMIGHYLAEFSISYKPVKHGRPGIGATHSSRFIPLK
uniref:40S ribosomal protein S15 n=3 Tax=Setaria TaxID=4554 RepID=K4AE50_SETIT